MRALAILILILVSFATPSQTRAEGTDQNRATSELEHHKILKLNTIFESLDKEIRKNFVDIEFERQGDRPVYEFEIVNRFGSLIELVVNARTGKVHGTERDED